MKKFNSILGCIAIILLVADICAGVFFTHTLETSATGFLSTLIESVGGE